ncbi:PTS system mannose/fructose/sorbose family transporter subunit IID [Breznakia pachnodae]|uniref:PTS system mannose-specific IID component n=1 Tax=Breznakia pachnodae TaxID=265178 RepID=A0ABU0E026_9FIRM|nr:PTS system mannose/fructose/sorbose family transporter subunit IID [Breznakia pachnodae]MDQ0360176.1 PTS system mannose-specific IID component [Breznakia pachnodae]
MASQKISNSTLKKVFVRNLFGLQWGWNYEKMQGLGYSFVIMPVLKELYGDDNQKMTKALQAHLAYFNTTPAMSHLIVGANIALEEEFGTDAEQAVSGLKTGLMGPFAGVGDTIFIAIYRAIVFSIASYIALEGNPVGLIIPILATLAVIFVRYKFMFMGYNQGRKLATGFADKIAPITEGASILGLTVVGGLIPSVISYTLDLTFTIGEVSLSMQEMLDRIMPSLIPLGIVLLSYWLLGKKKVNSTRLIFILILVGMVLGNLQTMVDWVAGLF